MPIVGIFVLMLAFNWILLIKRYRQKILKSLKALSGPQCDPATREHFDEERKSFESGRLDFAIAGLVLLMSGLMIGFPKLVPWPPPWISLAAG